MINYYEELNIERQLSVDEIQHQLNKLEQTWIRREVNAPDKARVMLTYITEARDTFKSELSRHEYDVALEKGDQTPENNPDEERRAKFIKWYEDAKIYLGNDQYDLAKISIEKAYSFYDQNSENADFFYDMSEIYRLNKDYDSALNYINQAIVLNHLFSPYYTQKAVTLWDKDPVRHRSEILKAFDDAEDYAIRDDNRYGIGSVKALIARYIFNYGNKPIESLDERYSLAEEYAQKALEYVENDENALWVLANINKIRKETEERQKAEEERRISEQKAEEERRKAEEKRRISEQKAEEERRKAEAEKRRTEEQRIREKERVTKIVNKLHRLYIVMFLVSFIWYIVGGAICVASEAEIGVIYFVVIANLVIIGVGAFMAGAAGEILEDCIIVIVNAIVYVIFLFFMVGNSVGRHRGGSFLRDLGICAILYAITFFVSFFIGTKKEVK